jgi:hypothetical protein
VRACNGIECKYMLILGATFFLRLTEYCLGYEINKTQFGRACSTYGERVHAEFLRGNLKEGDHLQEPRVDGKIILKWIFEWLVGGWSDVALDRDRWRVSYKVGNFLTSLGHEIF